jgi:hypothetical protein
MRQRLEGNDTPGACHQAKLDDHETDGATAEDPNVGAFGHGAQIHRMHCDRQRLDERGLFHRHRVRDREKGVVRPGHDLPQRPIDVAMTGETNLRTEMRGPDPAELASMTDRRRVDGDPLAASRPGHDHTCCFVAEDEWVVDARVADGPVQVPMTV